MNDAVDTGSAADDRADGRSPILRVVTLNVGSLLEPDWEQRRHEVVAWIDRLEPDVVCLQETWESDTEPNTGQWIAEAIAPPEDSRGASEWHWHFGGFPIPPAVWPDSSLRFGSTIISRWPIDGHELIRLPVVDDGGFASIVGWELLHARTAGLDVFSTHLAAAPTDAHHRRHQVLAIDDHIKRIRGDLDDLAFGAKRPHMPSILCGDFNAEPDSDEIRFLTANTTFDGRSTFHQDAWRVAGDGGQGLTQDWQKSPIAASLNVHVRPSAAPSCSLALTTSPLSGRPDAPAPAGGQCRQSARRGSRVRRAHHRDRGQRPRRPRRRDCVA